MNSDLILGIVIGVVGFFFLLFLSFLHMRITRVEATLKTLSPEVLARAMLKVKIPLSELPPDLVASFTSANPPNLPPHTPLPKAPYIG